jgi:nitrite reductase/ring-hydroxylating ferredoxin subunit
VTRTNASEMLVTPEGRLPRERYTTREFLDWEMEALWPKVWQVACREEEVAGVGDYVEYLIGDQSIVLTRHAEGEGGIRGFYNTCLHRGTKLADGCGTFANGEMKCRYHAWRYSLDGVLTDVVDGDEFHGMPSGLCLPEVRVECWGGFVFINMDLDAEPLLNFLDPITTLLGPYHLERMRFRSYRTTVLPANWKVVIDAFNEGYHVQGTHPQILPWTDDVNMAYEQFETHSHYGRLSTARRELRPSPRLGLTEADYEEGDILTNLVEGMGSLFLGEEMALVEEVRGKPLPPGVGLLEAYQERRMAMLADRGLDVSGLSLAQMTSADDFFWFPNIVGPIYPGSAVLFRVRPNGTDPDSAIKDTWVLEWPQPGVERRPLYRAFYPDWTKKDWGEITTQDYANMEHVQKGMKARGGSDLYLNTRQESNVLHMHRVIDRYLTSA